MNLKKEGENVGQKQIQPTLRLEANFRSLQRIFPKVLTTYTLRSFNVL